MKVLLVNPPYGNLGVVKEQAGCPEPLNLLYLASYLRKNNDCCRVAILDAEALGLSYLGIETEIRKTSPDVVALTFPTPAMKQVVEIARMAKTVNPHCIVVAGGPHPTALPRQVAEIPDIDFAVIGEGELTFSELATAISSRHASFERINGLAYESRGQVVLTEPREPIGDLDNIPFPARDLVDYRLYHAAPTERIGNARSSATVLTARGCPYDCTFCLSKVMWPGKVRYRSPENVVDELEECTKKHGLTEFNFIDDTLVVPENRAIEICKGIKDRNLGISWTCLARADQVSTALVRELTDAGCRKVSFGLESGSQRILNAMRKGITLQHSRRAVEITKEGGLEVHASFMLGNVGETERTIRETVEFAKKLDLDYATFFITVPYPGTELYEMALQKELIPADTEWTEFTPLTKTHPPLVQRSLAQEELLRWQKQCFREYYLRPKVLLKILLRIRSLQNIQTTLEGLRVFVAIQLR